MDLCLILNLRKRGTKSTMSVAELSEMVGAVAEDEKEYLLAYRDPPKEMMDEYEEEGWFRKNYETVKKYAEAYVRCVPGPIVIYTPEHGNASARVRITRLLGFYESMGRRIPFMRVDLAAEQTFVVRQDRGITVVNSGPGTGKTTTAAHKVAYLAFGDRVTERSDGVLVVSYTNAAVDNLQMRLTELVNDVGEISKKPGKRIWLTTIDSLSQMHLPKGQKRKDYDAQVESAIRDKDQFAPLFLTLDNKPMYSHIILDEAQDTSDERFRLLRAIYEEYSFKSFTIIGDPRQRLNIRYGGFYQEMLHAGLVVSDEDIERGVCPQNTVFDFERPLVVKYHHSYRFINPTLLDLANHLSTTRPSIHSQLLRSGQIAEGSPSSLPLMKYARFEQLTGDIIERVRAGTKPTNICIISPVTEKTSAAKSRLDAIRQTLTTNKIYTSSTYGDDAVYVSSIQSVKGLEFDHVYFIGASGYPAYMATQYQDVNDGMSMNFVANTRARYSLTYLTDTTMRPPDDVPDAMTTGGQAKAVAAVNESHPASIPSQSIELSDYEKFSSHNLLSVPHEQIASFSSGDSLQNYLYEIVSAIISHRNIQGRSVITQISESDKVTQMTAEKYKESVRLGMTYDMRGKTGAFRVTESQFPLLQSLLSAKYDETSLESHKIFRECLTGRASDLTDVGKISDVVAKVVRILQQTKPRDAETVGAEQDVVQEQIRATSIRTFSSIVVFSECLYLGAFVKKSNPTKNVYLVRLQSGVIVRIGDVVKPLRQYEYMVHALYAIATHVRLMRVRGRFSLAKANRKRPWYFVDTEFGPRRWLKSETIYDIALINGFDPFASTVSYLQCDPSSFRPMSGVEVVYSDLIGAPKAEEFHAFFSHLSLSETQDDEEADKPVIWYFSASHDISIFYEQNPHYMNLPKADTPGDASAWKYEPDLEYDFNFRNARTGNTSGTMSKLYQDQQGTPIEALKHIRLHTAISDALLLAEFVMTRDLGA